MNWNFLQQIDLSVLHFFNDSNNVILDQMAEVLTSGFTWIPLYLILFYIVVRNNETMAQIGLVVGGAALCILLADGLTDGIIKPNVARLRPCNDPMIEDTVRIVNHIYEKGFSFCSAHAANTMSLAVFFALLIRSRLLTITLITWSLVNCWTRLYLGVHYPSDILCGLMLGSTVGGLVYLLYLKLYRKISPDITYISNQYTRTGYDHDDIDIILCILALTITYVFLRACVMTYYI